MLELQRKTLNMIAGADPRMIRASVGVGTVLGSLVGTSSVHAQSISTPDCTGGTGNVIKLVGQVIGWAMALAGVLFVLIGVIGAIEWMTAGGNMGKVSKAQNRLKNAIIGLVILALIFLVRDVILDLVGGSDVAAQKSDIVGACKDV